jgi:ribosomal protein L12E/L44/L45/RPP1/RPP2
MNQVLQSIILANVQISSILKATGQKFDEAEITKVVTALKGKKIEDVLI